MIKIPVKLPKFQNGSAIVYVHLSQPYGVTKPLFHIDRVVERPTDKRCKDKVHTIADWHDDYRRLDPPDRRMYENQFFMELLGSTVYFQVLRDAWKMLEPDLSGFVTGEGVVE